MTVKDLLNIKIKIANSETILIFNSTDTSPHFHVWINPDRTLDSGVYTKTGLSNYKANLQNLT